MARPTPTRFPAAPKPAARPAMPSRRRGLAWLFAGGGAALAAVMAWQGQALGAAESAVVLPPPAQDPPAGTGARTEKAVFAGGCFWGVQGVFQHVQGVHRAVSGYAGGTAATANYETVGGGRTGHAESVEVSYDPAQVSYGTLLQIFFSVAHDPTQLDRQGPDFGKQYRSALFPLDANQQRVAKAYIAQLDAARAFKAPIATRIEPYSGFYPAEAYHQDFLTEHPTHPYIVVNDLPKVSELKRLFAARYREDAVLVKRGGA